MKTMRDQVGCKCTLQLNNNNKCIAGGITGEFMCWLSSVFWMQFSLSLFRFCTLPCNEKRWFMITTISATKPYDLCVGMAMQSARNVHYYLTVALRMATWAFVTLCTSFNADQEQLQRCRCRRCCCRKINEMWHVFAKALIHLRIAVQIQIVHILLHKSLHVYHNKYVKRESKWHLVFYVYVFVV